MSLTFPCRPLSPLAAGVAAAAAVAVGLTATPGLADQVRNHEWWLTEVHVTQAWQVSRGTGVTIAVLDTGVDPTQPDLSRSVVTGPDYTHSGRQPGDPYWGVHGTGVAVLIAGRGHGPGHMDGIIGIAPKAKILSVRVSLEPADPLTADPAVASRLPAAIAAGIRYAVHHGAQVIDLPLDPGAAAAGGTPGAAGAVGGSAAERKAVAYALTKGAVLIAPAGDGGPGRGQVNYPAAYPGVISVGAFNKGFVKARFSSRHSYVTLTAPGGGVITATSATGYATVSSTSAASAMVAGMAALIRARYPDLTPAQVGQALTAGSRFGRPAGRKNGSGYGTADAQGALTAAAQIETAIRPASPAPPATAPVARQAAAPHRRAALLRDAVIGVCAVLLLLLLTIIVVMKRRRARARARPAYGSPPTRPLSPRITAHDPDAYDGAASWSAAQARQRPQLAPVPKLEVAKRSKQADGPPWEPAPKPDSVPPWGSPDSIANGNGPAHGLPYPVGGLNGRSDAIWRASPGPNHGPPLYRDPASDPLAGPPAAPGSGVFRVPPALAPGGTPPGAPPALGSGDGAFSPPPTPLSPALGHGDAAFSPPPAPPPASPLSPALGHRDAPFGQPPTPPPTPPPASPPASPRPAPPPESGGNVPPVNGQPGGGAPDPRLPHRTGDSGIADRDQGAGPAYVWNPGAKTEDFPSLSSGRAGDEENGQPRPAAPTEYPGPAAPGAAAQAFPVVPSAGRHGNPDDGGGLSGTGGGRGYTGDDAAFEDDGGGYPDDDGSGYPGDDEDERHL
ncbi:MAG TPA: S8 family serine peptidase [Streptosporangiaceae bacterium]|nr:S8 family serine peptidase [Streptosporangiaceae bacterium]